MSSKLPNKIFVVGHRSPDLDAVCSAVVYAEILKKMKRYENAQIIPTFVGEVNTETKYAFERFGVELPKPIESYDISENDKFILVDHNEGSQRSPLVIDKNILEAVDHHKINMNFTNPIRIDVRPVGATCTIMYQILTTGGLEPSTEAKGLILSAILSDTVGLKSPTTTGIDSDAAHKLAEELKIDINEFTFEIFKAKSKIDDLSIQEILMKDYKIFDFSGHKVFVGVLETVEQDEILQLKEELLKELSELKTREGVSYAYFIVQDILAVNAKALYETTQEGRVLEEAFTAKAQDNICDIGPKLSRKKEIAPAIEHALAYK